MPSLSLLLGVGAAALSSVASATKYTAQDTHAGSSFFDNFNFVTKEKTNGFISCLTLGRYVDRSRALSQGYISYDGGDAVFGVDYKSKLDSSAGKDVGRESVRLEGKKEYNKGLFVLDIKHMPGGICGTWPAFWSLGREPWPVKGEIDIIEGVNRNTANQFALHTDTNCKVDGLGQTGTQVTHDCALDGASGSSGCNVNDANTASYSTGFNANQGGYYVTEWQADSIKVWFCPRGSAPKSLQTSEPDTTEFGTPNANFKGACDIEKRFIFTNTFCGDWAGNVYASSGCPVYAGRSGMDSCQKFVAENPQVFKDAYWCVSSFKTYNKRAIENSS
ncbi:mixed-linked glucanase, partial [Lizonia empirigonia]